MPNPLHTPQYAALRQLLADERKGRGISQAGVAAAIGKPQSFVSKYENGERRLDMSELIGVLDALGASVEDFLRRYLHVLEIQGLRVKRAPRGLRVHPTRR